MRREGLDIYFNERKMLSYYYYYYISKSLQ